jgi:hypothetical protein
MIFNSSGKIFSKIEFSNEVEIEKVVTDNFKLIFGDYSFLLAKSLISTSSGKGTIPDGIIINFEEERWYILEVERGIHGTWEHIAPQIVKQITAMQNEETKVKIAENCIKQIVTQSDFIELLNEIDIKEINIHGYINRILKKEPIISLPIDLIPDDLEDWAKSLKVTVEIRTVEKYSDINGNLLYNLPDIEIDNTNNIIEKNNKLNKKPDNALEILIKAGLIKETDKVYFDYGPKGTKKKHFDGIIRLNGIEVDNITSSVSISSLRCIQSMSPTRTTSNGWSTWKTANGKILDNIWKKYIESLTIAST